MTFTSLLFFGFLPIVISLYFIVPQRYRWFILLISSYYFYILSSALNIIYIFILIFATIISFFLAIFINRTENKKKRKIILLTGTIILLGLLFIFKYLGFFKENINFLFSLFDISVNIKVVQLVVPMGMSFYTFQILSYLIDVYNDKVKPEKHFGIYAAGIAFFPKLISGPIERSNKIFPQLYVNHQIEYERIIDGIKLIIWGLFKKVVIADRIAFAVNSVYGHPNDYQGFSIIIATIFLSFQIYADFSGYTDIAIGISKILGIQLTDNFNRPYLSDSIGEFWKRWHITLSFWLRDYIFLPLAYIFSRKIIKLKLNIKPEVYSYISSILITMFFCGIWHGANWTFIFWGIIQGFYLSIGFLLKKPRKRFYKKINLNKTFHKYLKIITCFILVTFSWLFFRANSLSDSILLIKNLFKFNNSISLVNLFDFEANFYISVVSICFLIAIEIIQTYRQSRNKEFSITKILNVPIILLILLSIFVYGKFEQVDFLYFKF
jgi:alginate O-acetyltransferase complex protein AlgI